VLVELRGALCGNCDGHGDALVLSLHKGAPTGARRERARCGVHTDLETHIVAAIVPGWLGSAIRMRLPTFNVGPLREGPQGLKERTGNELSSENGTVFAG
jgi:hypothetical protein